MIGAWLALSARQISKPIFVHNSTFPDKIRHITTFVDMEKNPYGEKIRKVRALRGYTQEYMAEKLQLGNPKTYSRYEAGESKLDLNQLEAIADVLGMSLMDLLSFDEKVLFHQCNDNNVVGVHNTYHEASTKEREQLLERIKHLEEEVVHLRNSVAFLQDQLRTAVEARK